MTGTYADRIAADLPTPRVGVWQCINISSFLVWVVMLSFALLRRAVPSRQVAEVA